MALRPPRKRMLFVTGGSGFLGHQIVNGAASADWEIVAPSSAGLDLRNRDSVLAVVRDWKPTAIVHTAYRKSDRSTIVDATRNVAEAAAATGARLVHVSTDAVFGGRRREYTEHDLPVPINDYGRDKRDAELIVAELCPGAVITRPSLLIGRHGGPLSPPERDVAESIAGRSRTVFYTDEVRTPLLVDDFAAALTQLAARPDIAGLLHLGGPDALSRAEMAIAIARRHGWDATRIRVGEMGDARHFRPDHLVLDSSRASAMGLSMRNPFD
jgi:dTDP-4-dehydrorhamnose reductase